MQNGCAEEEESEAQQAQIWSYQCAQEMEVKKSVLPTCTPISCWVRNLSRRVNDYAFQHHCAPLGFARILLSCSTSVSQWQVPFWSARSPKGHADGITDLRGGAASWDVFSCCGFRLLEPPEACFKSGTCTSRWVRYPQRKVVCVCMWNPLVFMRERIAVFRLV